MPRPVVTGHPKRRVRACIAAILLIIALPCLDATAARASDCSAVAVTGVAAPPPPGSPPLVHAVTDEDDPAAKGWIAPVCTGWTAPGYRTLILYSGQFHEAGGVEALLRRLGAVSAVTGLRYWSRSDSTYEVLFLGADALTQPDMAATRADFGAEELATGQDYYFRQKDNRTDGWIVSRMRFIEIGPDRIVLTVENISKVRFFGIKVADPGALQSINILERVAGDVWRFDLLSRTGRGASALITTRTESLVNRGAALWQFMAGLPDNTFPAPIP